ncbi:hypothetical protein JW826_02660 [Candidatus Woesearchaeota archaeon]|nr:hypothetical protein [Candidatus Woesearchaeota archaeon]
MKIDTLSRVRPDFCTPKVLLRDNEKHTQGFVCPATLTKGDYQARCEIRSECCPSDSGNANTFTIR